MNGTQVATFTDYGWLLPTGLTRPLSLNDRMHHMAKARLVKTIRSTIHAAAFGQRIGAQDHVHVRLEYAPRDNRRRDTDNLWATAKPAIDGLVDAGIIPDDTTQYVTRHEPLILPASRDVAGSRLWLRVWVELTEVTP